MKSTSLAVIVVVVAAPAVLCSVLPPGMSCSVSTFGFTDSRWTLMVFTCLLLSVFSNVCADSFRSLGVKQLQGRAEGMLALL